MAELRRDPLTGRWVVLAASRADRPHELSHLGATPTADPGTDDCPFCTGHEDRTLPEVARRGPGAADSPGWTVRVVPNLFPIVAGATGAERGGDDLRRARPAGGTHEVVVLSPDHDRSLARLDDTQATLLFEVVQARMRAHAAAGHLATQVIVNHGAGAGASLSHPHAQILAIDLVPPVIEQELEHLAVDGDCVLCRELERHSADPALGVLAGEAASLWCPWWSATAYELLLAPRRHLARFEDAGGELRAVATLLRDGLARLAGHLDDPPYNVILHSLPAGATGDFHWHLHIRPRLQVEAGLELGTGIGVNTVDPAEAARHLR